MPSVRLMVRPGITGWAQVNGGALLSPEEKERFDEEYVNAASPWFDLRIFALTICCILQGDRRSRISPAEREAAQARASEYPTPIARASVATRFATSVAPPPPEEARVSAARSV